MGEAMISMVKEVLNAEQARWGTRIADANSALEKASAEQTEKVGAKDAVDAELRVQKDVVRAKYDAQSKANEVVDECREELSVARSLHGDAEVTMSGIAKTRLNDLVLQETIAGLKESKYENAKDVRKHIAEIAARLQNLGAEEALVKTLPQILRSKPGERGTFDEMALQQLDWFMKDHLGSLSSESEAADKILTEQATAVKAWEATIEVAEDKRRETDEALEVALAQQEQIHKALLSARKTVKEFTAVVKHREADLATEHWGLQSVEEVLDALEILREWELHPAPQPEELKEHNAHVPEAEAPEKSEMTVEDETLVTTSMVPITEVKQNDVTMNLDDVPSPSKKTRTSLGGGNEPSLVVA